MNKSGRHAQVRHSVMEAGSASLLKNLNIQF
ncbi:hypothetical protein F441_20871 [Phytophthora nicotianae CJ01A1]|uniref:Uncharacterized protein n=1 Tax=Phytophthora nicotianae CJ01A1 TaxID=1317063 RepID=W2VUG8_PHYNI|nr:hypothetical protein F441_20871 [Phytophthora nicotianae CJ01A1]